MSTISITKEISENMPLCQGDIFKDVTYRYIEPKYNDDFLVTEYTFPLAIIISQACDTISASELWIKHKGEAAKFMPSILLCPIYNETEFRQVKIFEDICREEDITINTNPFCTSKQKDVMKEDFHYRFHMLTVNKPKMAPLLSEKIIDFKQYFTLPVNLLLEDRKEKRIARLDDIYAQQITLKFASYLSRVAIPDIVDSCTI